MDYIAVHIKIEPFREEWAEIVEAEIADLGFDSFTVEEPYLNAFIPKDLFSEPNLKTLLGGFGGGDFNVSHTVELVKEQNWNAAWESDFEPVVVGDQVTVRAKYHKNLPRTRINVVIDPQMSFGSGHHQTTTMMIEQLLEDRKSLKGKAVLDMGCGTGILAIVAAKLGAAVPVHAVDIDPRCARSTLANARRNRIPHKLAVVCGDASVLIRGQYDYILANINRNILLADMASYVRALKPQGGTILLSGFYTADIPLLLEAAAPLGLTEISRRTRDDWALLVLKKQMPGRSRA
ncbi:MAG: 50S ribosomal protein L11 methyltransferase [Bacteroidales bacterium]|nr:50S ribosomal protein L11 methyltransferase [Bacteroidales bacterium]